MSSESGPFDGTRRRLSEEPDREMDLAIDPAGDVNFKLDIAGRMGKPSVGADGDGNLESGHGQAERLAA